MIHVVSTEKGEGWMGMLRIEVTAAGNEVNTNNTEVQKSHCCDACMNLYD